jgi:hypothetical protein
MILTDELIDKLASKHRGQEAQLVRRGLIYLRIQKACIQLSEDREVNATRMKDDTPYHHRPTSEIERERLCKTFIFGHHLPPVAHIWEAFGGIGLTGQILAQACPQAHLYAVDLDTTCVKMYNKALAGRGKAVVGDAADYIAKWDKLNWAASLDFNKFTLLDLTERVCWRTALIDEVVSHQPKWIHISDSASKYLHLNWRQYGISGPHLLTYLNKLDLFFGQIWGYYIWRVGRHHGAAQTLLLPKPPRRSNWKAKNTDRGVEYFWRD